MKEDTGTQTEEDKGRTEKNKAKEEDQMKTRQRKTK